MLLISWAGYGLSLCPIVLAQSSQYSLPSTSGGNIYSNLSSSGTSSYSSPRLSSAPPKNASSLSTDRTCFNIRTFPSASSSSSRCCGPCTILYPDVQILHWPVTRTNTWCDSLKEDLSRNPFTTIGPTGGVAPIPTGAVVGYVNVSTAGFDKDLLTQGPAILYESIDNNGNVVKGATLSDGGRGSHMTKPPSNVSFSIDDNGFVYVSPSIYVVIPYVIATDDCAPVPPIYTSVILAYPEGKLLTAYDPTEVAGFLNPADLGCPPEYAYLPQNGEHVLTSTNTVGRVRIPDQSTTSGGLDRLRTLIAEYTPSVYIDVQERLPSIVPQWKNCSAYNFNSAYPFGRDPPKVIQPMNALAGPTTADDGQAMPTSSPSIPQAKSAPSSPIPTMTPSSNKPEIQASVAPHVNSISQSNFVPEPGAAPTGPSSMSGLGQGTLNNPSNLADPNHETQDYPLNPPDPSKGGQDPAADPFATGKASPNHPPDLSDPHEVTQHEPSASSNILPYNDRPGTDAATAYPAQTPETLPNAPAFAQFDPQPVQTQDVVAAATSNHPTFLDTQPNPASPQSSNTAAGIGAFVNAAINGLISSHEASPPGSLGGTPLVDASANSGATANSGAFNLESTGVSYSRSFSLQLPHITTLGNVPSASASNGILPTQNSAGQISTGLPNISPTSSTNIPSTTVQDLSSLIVSQNGQMTTGTESSGSQTGTSGKAGASSASKGRAAKQSDCGSWKLGAAVILGLTLLF